MTTSGDELVAFDTQSWRQVSRLPELPDDALRYFPSPKGDRAVVETKRTSVNLWNPATRQTIATLKTYARCRPVAFSPDGTRVATVTSSTNGPEQNQQVEIWTTDTGKPAQDAAISQGMPSFGVTGLAWTPDGQYLLVATRPNAFYTSYNITIVNAKTGRPRGDLVGCPTTIVGMGLLPKSGQVVAGCEDGKIRFWDLNAALQSIKTFEASLPK